MTESRKLSGERPPLDFKSGRTFMIGTMLFETFARPSPRRA
jgi:hypothetical protein